MIPPTSNSGFADGIFDDGELPPEAEAEAEAPETPETPELPEIPVPPAPDAPAEWIEHLEGLELLAERVARASLVALDTEANSMHAYREQTCIVQITVDGYNAVLDVLALPTLAPLRAALDRPDVEIILHGGDYDISCLTRDHDFVFHRVFDTMIASTLLGVERVGLQALVEHHYGDLLNKRFQRADWARRPVSDEQMDYLRRDTIYLPGLRAVIREQLARADLEEEAAIEFQRLTTRRGKPFEPNPDAWRRAKGAARLDDLGRCVLRALWAWREGVAQSRDVPPFKVISPGTLVSIAAKPPTSAKHAGAVPFLSKGERSRYGRALAAALERGLAAKHDGDIPPRSNRPALPPEEVHRAKVERSREDALKTWRRGEIGAREVPGVVVLPNVAIQWLSENDPETLVELEACIDIGPKRISRYGEAVLQVLAKLRA